MKRVLILGSTGSIGVQALEVIDAAPDMQCVGLACGTRVDDMLAQAGARGIAHASAAAGGGTVAHTADLGDLMDACEPDIVLNALVGAAGLPPTLAALDRGVPVALANKESLVAGGDLVAAVRQRTGAMLVPVDSEHSALFQLLEGVDRARVARAILTASGGPFRGRSAAELEGVGPADALAHPTWDMGAKITIDSATLMNKALEVIEAHWLFDLPSSRIDAIVHPQSVVHSFVEFRDGSTIAQLSPPSMRLPIQYALTWPHRAPGCSPTISWDALRSLEFEPVDHARFPAIGLAKRVIDSGGSAGAVLNAANEVAVEAFIAGTLLFGDIPAVVAETLDGLPPQPVRTLGDVLKADREGRALAQERIARRSPARSAAGAR